MGITSEEFFQNIYSVIFTPKSFFNNEDVNVSIRVALGVVVLISVINKTSNVLASGSIGGLSYIFSLIGGMIGAVITWFITALIFEYVAKIFDRSGHLQKLLYLTAFASVPSIFFAPLSLLKQAGEMGYILSVLSGLILYAWIVILHIFAIKDTYKISLARACMFIFLPIISSVLFVYQTAGFYNKMWYIFSI